MGGAVGVLLGGILVNSVSWEWIFFINVPVGVAVIIASPRLLTESRVEMETRSFDFAGAVAVTAGLTLLVYGLVSTDSHSWTSALVLASLVGALLLLLGFVAIEQRARAPLLPFSIFRLRSLTGANVAGLLLGASIFSMFFLLVALHAAGARLLAAQGGAQLPADRRDDHLRRGGVTGDRHPAGRAPDPGRPATSS